MSFSGGCFCGAVRYECTGEPVFGGHCHCTRCRKASGTGHSSMLAVPKAGLEMSGTMRFYDAPADSGNMVSRGFCPTCGSAIVANNSGMPDLAFLVSSSLDDPEVFKADMVVYAAQAPTWDQTDPALPAFDAMPPAENMP